MVNHGPQNGPKTVNFPNALFLHFSWDLPTILAGGPNPNAQKGTVSPRGPNLKVLIIALEKVLTNETPLYIRRELFRRVE